MENHKGKRILSIGKEFKCFIQVNYSLKMSDVEEINLGSNLIIYSFIDEPSSKKYVLKCKFLPQKKEFPKVYDELRFIREKHFLPNICLPITNKDGSFFSEYNDSLLVYIFPFISGNSGQKLENCFTKKDFIQLGRVMGKLHSIKLGQNYIPIENTYFIAKNLNNEITELLKSIHKQNEGNTELSEFFKSQENKIYNYLNYFIKIASKINSSSKVLTHGDLHFNNLIAKENELIHIIDWEDTSFAHVEKDLKFFLTKNRKDFFLGYREINPKIKLSAEAVGFYYCKWLFEEISKTIFYSNDNYHNKLSKHFTLKNLKESFEEVYFSYTNLDDFLDLIDSKIKKF